MQRVTEGDHLSPLRDTLNLLSVLYGYAQKGELSCRPEGGGERGGEREGERGREREREGGREREGERERGGREGEGGREREGGGGEGDHLLPLRDTLNLLSVLYGYAQQGPEGRREREGMRGAKKRKRGREREGRMEGVWGG